MLALFSRWALRMHPASESKRESMLPHFLFLPAWGTSIRFGSPQCFTPCRTQLPELVWKAKNLRPLHIPRTKQKFLSHERSRVKSWLPLCPTVPFYEAEVKALPTSPNTVAHLRREKPPHPEAALTEICVYALRSGQENRSDQKSLQLLFRKDEGHQKPNIIQTSAIRGVEGQSERKCP